MFESTPPSNTIAAYPMANTIATKITAPTALLPFSIAMYHHSSSVISQMVGL